MARMPENAFPPIGSYGLIGDCRTCALIGLDGSVDWFCLPHFGGPSLFAALLDRERGGRFGIAPAAPFRSRHWYLEETALLVTRFETDSGSMQLTDCMPLPPADGELAPLIELLRCVEVTEGEVELELRFEPRPDYGRAPVRIESRGRLGLACTHGDALFLLYGEIPLALDDPAGAVTARLRLRAGERRYVALAVASRDIGTLLPLGADADARVAATRSWWERWSSRCRYRGPHRSRLVRSLVTLKLLTYAPSGAMVAAPTTSLPESPGGSRNWDYRYCWLRDSAFVVQGLVDVGHEIESEAFVSWLLHATRLTRPRLQVLYTVFGEARVCESELTHLRGYGGARPVRIGNEAWGQLQLDVYGELVQAAYDYLLRGGRLDSVEKRVLVGFGEVVCRVWRLPDQGIWERRGPPRHNTHSKLMCWVALDRLVSLDAQGLLRVPRHFTRERDAIRDTIESRGYNPALQAYVSELDGDRVDAALLVMPRYDFIAADHPRMRGTDACIRTRLDRGGVLLRYEPGTDDLPGDEAPFGVCSFWEVDYLAQAGRLGEAEALFERLLDAATELGLYAEELEPARGEQRGNFPQAFTHVGHVTATLSLADAYSGRREVL